VAYILSIKNPANYTGFYLGVGSSALLGVQFYLNGLFDLTFLYFVVFIPFQIMAIMSWKKGSKTQKEEVFAPEFLNMSTMLITLFAFLAIIVVDYLFATFVMYGDGLCENVVAKIISGSMIAASVLANYWLIYKKNDSWLYWLVYSVAGMLLAVVVTSNIFSLVLFTFFLVINGVATMAWIKATPKEKYGWLKK
jgi:nicotinamide riboside transporter PnuC